MKLFRSLLLLISLLTGSLASQAIIYTKQDSIKVVRLLTKGQKQPTSTNLVLFYANQFKGVPYVAATLEKDPSEQLVVNLRQLDCTTFVETVLALTLTTERSKSIRFSDYCHWLECIRYRGGERDGYTSRNHYFSQWIRSNEKLGFVKEQTGSKANHFSPFTAKQTIDLHYMSQHADKYAMLRTDKQKALIRQYEEEVNGTVVRYIPTASLAKGKDTLSQVHDGDILALVTKKDGLDVSHLGFAVWGKDGHLHLLNASSIYHKVVLDSNTLYKYQTQRPSQLGIRVLRVL